MLARGSLWPRYQSCARVDENSEPLTLPNPNTLSHVSLFDVQQRRLAPPTNPDEHCLIDLSGGIKATCSLLNF